MFAKKYLSILWWVRVHSVLEAGKFGRANDTRTYDNIDNGNLRAKSQNRPYRSTVNILFLLSGEDL
jgi:hypothetical protein